MKGTWPGLCPSDTTPDFELEAADMKSRDCAESIGWVAEAASKHKVVGARGSICWPGSFCSVALLGQFYEIMWGYVLDSVAYKPNSFNFPDTPGVLWLLSISCFSVQLSMSGFCSLQLKTTNMLTKESLMQG